MMRWTRRAALFLPLLASPAPVGRAELRDRDGRLLGWVAQTPTGMREARDRNGRLLGFHDPVRNETRDRNGHLLYRGDALAALIVCQAGQAPLAARGKIPPGRKARG